VIAGWLYRQTCRRASNFLRAEMRRKNRERTAMSAYTPMNPPVHSEELARELDTAMNALPATDRNALVVRYFENADHAAVGRALGISEDAARKRVRRALDRLGAIFKRKGILTASASLGGTLRGFGGEPLPAGLVATICNQAMKAAPAGVGSLWVSFLKPVIAGVAATSIISAAVVMVRPGEGPEISRMSSNNPISPTGPERTLAAVTLDQSSLEAILAELQHAVAGPANARTSLRLEAAFERLGNERIPEFIALANGKLAPQERVALYRPLLERWLSQEPEKAMTFTLESNVGKQVDGSGLGGLLDNLFLRWARRDADACAKWLIASRENPALQGNSFMFLANSVADHLIDAEDKQPLLDLFHALPSEAERKALFASVTGESLWGSLNRFHNLRTGLEVNEFLKNLPNAPWKSEVRRKFLSRWMENAPAVFEQAASTLPAADAFEIALARLGARRVPSGERTAVLSGGVVVKSKPTDPVQGGRDAMQAAIAAGVPRGEALEAIGAILLDRLPEKEALAWVDAHRSEVDLDDPLAEKARWMAQGIGSMGGVPFEIIGIRWASRIGDAERRARLCRALFRGLGARDPQTAADWLDHPDMPDDLSDSFHAILQQAQ
jgi:hypothetical protein